MKQYIEHDLVILPSKQSSFGLIHESNNLHIFTNGENPHDLLDNLAYPQHFYITSNDEIKDGEWCIVYNSMIRQYQSSVIYSIPCKKIIATTDKSLTIKKWKQTNKKSKPYNIQQNIETTKLVSFPLSQIPQQFIEYFINEYNKGNTITKVLVEYNTKIITSRCQNCSSELPPIMDCTCDNKLREFKEHKLVINPNNTINIKPIEVKMYSRDEVIGLFNIASSNCHHVYQIVDWAEKNV